MTNENMIQCVRVAAMNRIWEQVRELMVSNTKLNHTSGTLHEPLEKFPSIVDRLEGAGVVVTGDENNYRLDWSNLHNA
ncbi:hypothetical protein [Lactiplantibacillus daowaiensis]|uniref:Uncharacterized protein n=1 Tax=Lactiplantibacillus daowaiensis TaxID=2559918 RepID=A0ABW1RXQ6_9LACO|nr:hypothetical protein [Lactiplantibacillus daowaiensis]